MCIRDSTRADQADSDAVAAQVEAKHLGDAAQSELAGAVCCLLYTSDAADERSSVDLGGRRIIKKKKQCK